jgi:hypothetical protein
MDSDYKLPAATDERRKKIMMPHLGVRQVDAHVFGNCSGAAVPAYRSWCVAAASDKFKQRWLFQVSQLPCALAQ